MDYTNTEKKPKKQVFYYPLAYRDLMYRSYEELIQEGHQCDVIKTKTDFEIHITVKE